MRTIVLLFVWASSAFAAELHLSSAAVAANEPAALTVSLQSGQGVLTGLQFDLEYDFSRFELKVEIGLAAENAAKVLQTNVIQPGRLRVLIFGINRTQLADGVVAIARIALKGKADTGQEYPIRISQPVGSSSEGETVPVTGTGGSVTTGLAMTPAARRDVR
jgi:hypothetical protein